MPRSFRAAFIPFVLLGWGDGGLAAAVAMALPGFQPTGKHPAFGSGPLATVVQDLLSIVVYLAIATLLAS